MIAVAFDQCGQEDLAERTHIWVVKAQAGQSTDPGTHPDFAVSWNPFTVQIASMRILSKCPFRRAIHQLRNNDLDSILRGQIHHPVVI